MAGSILFAVVRMTSLNAGSVMLLVTVTPSNPLRLPFSLNVSRWSSMCKGTFLVLTIVFTTSNVSAASFHLISGVPVTQGKSMYLSASVEFLTGSGNTPAAVLSQADPRLAVAVLIRLCTVCFISTRSPDILNIANVAMLWKGLVGRGVVAALGGTC